ncbi:uncharacterized protein A1O9_00141 [Exophiala aquamarina CBS 119918]|uniref:Acyltransferase 3 domain-containing protein n=1 Tax=Exophiala aquamarina CBS 119918 TaxID=1182545 RepID=A0A072PPY4_9EURO|nr:uncharacterized protein A1O9_00141 [Exophiala aquamarina CBS 119918]KEF62169.1 hypothetical protein A1O9_00141 [Exophiala aquamarina CBS 119918]
MEQSFPLLSQSAEDEVDHAYVGLEKLPKRAWSSASTALHYILPTISFLHSALPRFLQIGGLKSRKEKHHSTAWLDALRGYAACVVVKFHLFNFSQREIFHQPILHAFEAGRGSVEVFFVISGYVLSVRVLKMIRNQQAAPLLNGLASATFRRFLRLYVPTAFATLLVALALQVGLVHIDKLWKPTLYEQLADWMSDTIYASDPFHDVLGWWINQGYRTKYAYQLWTIPLEFRGSMALFLFLLGSCKLTTRGRMVLSWIVIVCCYRWQAHYVACFLAGMCIADVSISFPPEQPEGWLQLPQHQMDTNAALHGRREKWIGLARKGGLIFMFIMGLFFLSVPADTGTNGPWPFQYVSMLTPSYYGGDVKEYFWLSIGAILLVLSLEYSPTLQVPLRWSFSLYLGEISFGIYAIHILCNWILYEPYLKPWQADSLGDSIWADWLVASIMYFVVFVAADYFTRVDTQIVTLGRWLQNRLFVQWE